MAQGHSGLLHATTGSGKTYAVWLGAVQLLASSAQHGIAAKSAAKNAAKSAAAAPTSAKRTRTQDAAALTVIWLTPMRALAADTAQALQTPLADIAPNWVVGLRTGDTSSAERAAQQKRLPTALVTTPESLSLLLSRADAEATLGRTALVVVDEWHELMGNKRGVQVQLALARLRRWNPKLMVWGMSATLGNLDQALRTLLGYDPIGTVQVASNGTTPLVNLTRSTPRAGLLVQGETAKNTVIDTLLPPHAERFPWAGHVGLTMLHQVVEALDASASSLVFTNTRAQAELWYQALLDARPDWAGAIALHHGSLSASVREWVEAGLKNGNLRTVVCTSSLDLGVDFLPVERVLQIGSPKGVARLLQRAGRAGHAPGKVSRVSLVPTHSLELIEAAAVKHAVQVGHIEARQPLAQPLDVLVQHLVTVGLGGGFVPDDLLQEVRSTAAYAHLPADDWQWCLDFVRQGGQALNAYPDYHRVRPDENGIWRVPDARLARRHRANIGTIVSNASMVVQFVGGAKLGTVEENFIARLQPKDCFLLAGRMLQLVRVHDMTAWVKRATGQRPVVPRWSGGRLPLSHTLADAVVQQLALAAQGQFDSPALRAAQPMLAVQTAWSALPTPDTLLAEVLQSREGVHLFLYPFAGRHVHMGLANLLAWRIAQLAPQTFSMAVNDYGLELLCPNPIDWMDALPRLLAAPHDRAALLPELLGSLNASELAQRRFREIARVAGLVFQSHPGEHRSSKQLQASASLFWGVFRQYDPSNRLLLQAQQELLSEELEIERLRITLSRMARQTLVIKPILRPTPFAFPLLVERLREKLSNEQLADRIARMVAQLEKTAGDRDSVVSPLPKRRHRKRPLPPSGQPTTLDG